MTPRSFQREAYTKTPLPEMVMVAHSWYKKARAPGLLPHYHRSVYEIFHMTGGRVIWWIEKETHELTRGDIFITRPGEVHGSVGSVLQPCEYYWVQLILDSKKALPGLSLAKTREIKFKMDHLKKRRFRGGPELKSYYEKILFETKSNLPEREFAARAALHLLLSSVLRYSIEDPEQIDHSSYSFPVQSVITLLRKNILKPIKLPQIAKVTGFSSGYLRERFFAETGFTPTQFLLRERIAAAKRVLQEKPHLSITEIAHSFYFSSSQYFATVFKNIEGTTPMEIRKNLPSLSDKKPPDERQ